MKTPSDDLFRLIKSMTVAEKRHFKQNMEINQTSELFDIINALDEYDEEIVKKRIKDESFRKNLKVHKNRLQQLLLRSLRLYNEDETIAQRIRENIDYIEILLAKRLYDLAYQHIQRTKKLCETSEEYELLLAVLGMEARHESYFGEFIPKEQSAMTEMSKCISLINNYVQHAHINRELITIFTTKVVQEKLTERADQFNRMMESQLLNRPEMQPQSPIAWRMYNYSMAMWRRVAGDYQGYYQYTKANIDIFHSNPPLIESRRLQYFNAMINHILACQFAENYAEVDSNIILLENLAAKHIYFEPYLLYVYSQAIMSMKQQQQWERAIAFYEKKILPLIAAHELTANYHSRIISSFMVEVYLVVGKPHGAGDCLRIIDARSLDVNHELFEVSAVLELIYHIEQGDYALLESLTNAIQKRIRRHKVEKPFLEAALTFARRFNSLGVLSHRSWFATHQQQLDSYREDPTFQLLSGCFAYDYWLTARANKLDWNAYLVEKKWIYRLL